MGVYYIGIIFPYSLLTTSKAYYNGINCEKFCSLVKQHGSPLWQYLQIYGILVPGSLESNMLHFLFGPNAD